jgi:hypothetical protein
MPMQAISDNRRLYFESSRIINRQELLIALKEKAGCSTLARQIKQGSFPSPTVKKGRCKCWELKDIEHFIDIHKLKIDKPFKKVQKYDD